MRRFARFEVDPDEEAAWDTFMDVTEVVLRCAGGFGAGVSSLSSLERLERAGAVLDVEDGE